MTTKKNYVQYLFTKEKKIRNHKSKPINQRYIIWNKYQIICPNQNIQKKFHICIKTDLQYARKSTKFKWKTTKSRINQRHGNVNKHADEIKKRMCVSVCVCEWQNSWTFKYISTWFYVCYFLFSWYIFKLYTTNDKQPTSKNTFNVNTIIASICITINRPTINIVVFMLLLLFRLFLMLIVWMNFAKETEKKDAFCEQLLYAMNFMSAWKLSRSTKTWSD